MSLKTILKNKLKKLLLPNENQNLKLSDEEIKKLNDYNEKNSKIGTKIPINVKVVLFEPRSFEETEGIAGYLKEKRATVVNLHRLQSEYSQRVIDFLSGVVFAIDGTIQKVGSNVILCTPNSIKVKGEISSSGSSNGVDL